MLTLSLTVAYKKNADIVEVFRKSQRRKVIPLSHLANHGRLLFNRVANNLCSPTHTRKQKQCILWSLFVHFKGPNNTVKKKRNKTQSLIITY